VESCPICDNWNQTPHAKRFTTPIPPQYAEEAMIIGFLLGIRQGTKPVTLCAKHQKEIVKLDGQFQRRTAPTTPPPPPPRIPMSQVLASKAGRTPAVNADLLSDPPATVAGAIAGGAVPKPPELSGLRQSFSNIAQSCAAEYIKQHSGPQTFDPKLNNDNPSIVVALPNPESDKQLITEVPPDILRQALRSIAEHSDDPEVAQFAARVLDGTAMPPPQPSTQSLPAGTIPCAICKQPVKPGEVHACS